MYILKFIVTLGLMTVLHSCNGTVEDMEQLAEPQPGQLTDPRSSLAEKITINSGNFQSAFPLAEFAKPVVLTLVRGDKPVPGATINLAVTNGEGIVVTPSVLTTDNIGMTSFMVQAGPTSGPVIINATWGTVSAEIQLRVEAPVNPTSTITLSALEGRYQSGTSASAFVSSPLIVQLANSGIPMPGETINFALTAGSGGSFASQTVVTNNDGKAATTFTPPDTVGMYEVTASWQSGLKTANFVIVVNADAVNLSIVSGNTQLGTVSTLFTKKLKVRLTKSAAAYAGQTIDWAVTSGSGATLSNPTSLTTTQGYAEISFTAGGTPGGYEVSASWNGGQNTVTFGLIANAVNDYRVLSIESGNLQGGAIGTLFNSPIVVSLTDGGTPIVGQAIAFAITGIPSGATGQLISSATVNTDASGLAQVNFTSGSVAGTYEVTASALGKTVKFNLISSDNVSLAVVSGNAQLGTVSTLFSGALKVRLTNSGAAYAGQIVSWALTTGTGATLGSTTSVTDAQGYSEITFTAGASAGSYEVSASWNSGQKTVTFGLIANAVNDYRVLAIESGNFQIGATSSLFDSPLVVSLADAGTPIVGQAIAFAITTVPTGAAGQLVSAASVNTNASGIAQVDFTGGNLAGTYEVTVSALGKSLKFNLITSATASQKIVKIVASGAGAQSQITTASIDLATQTLPVKAALYDITGTNYISDVAVSWTLTGGGFNGTDLSGSAVNTTSITFAPVRTGSTILTATYTGSDPTVIGTSASTGFLTVSSSVIPQVIVTVSGDNQSAIAGNNLSSLLTVRVTNSTGTNVPGYGVNFTTTQGGGVVTTGQPVLTDANGLAQAQVQLGTAAMTNIFRATVVSAPTLTRDFQATATAGAATKLAFSTQPALAYRNFKFLTQPIVVIQDTNGNLVTTANNSVTLTKTTGAGTFIGTVTMTAVNGIATFTDVGWDTQENNVRITAGATGLTSINSDSFNVGAPLTSACTTETAAFKTQEGGCKDLASGLVWSDISTTTMVLNQIIWDATFAGSSASDVYDNGRTNDYINTSTAACGGGRCDDAAGAYCHDLIRGGYSDWRIPSMSDFQTSRANGFISAQSGLSTLVFLSTQVWTPGWSLAGYRFSDNTAPEANPGTGVRAICVRGMNPMKAATKVQIATFPSTGITLTTNTFTIVARVVDASNNQVNAQNIPITIALTSGMGVLSGTLTVNTNSQGRATFSNLIYSASEMATFVGTSPGYADSAAFSIQFSDVPGGCSAPNSGWSTTQGGCKDASTGLVWSAPSSVALSWYNFIWDSMLSGSSAPDASDGSWTNDFDHTSKCLAPYCDTSAISYCHDLVQGGRTDWRAPTHPEIGQARANGLHNQISHGGAHFWTSTLNSSGNIVYRFSDNNTTGGNHTGSGYLGICVRGSTRETATKLLVITAPSSMTLTNTSFSFIVRMADAAGGWINKEGVPVTLSRTTGTGALGGTTTVNTDSAGRAVFNVTYNTTETATLVASATGYTSTSGNSIFFSEFPAGCVTSGNWSAANGGCYNSASGLTWSLPNNTGLNWYQIVWDASYAGSSAVDASDSGWSNDFDYGGNSCSTIGVCDASPQAYCHDLSEGGKTDWRMPSITEMQTARGDGITSQLVLGSGWYHSATVIGSNAYYVYYFSSGTTTLSNFTGFGTPSGAICVRSNSGRPAMSKVEFTSTAQIAAGTDVAFEFSARLYSAAGTAVSRSGIPVTVALSSGSGTLSGTLTVNTNDAGIATFSNVKSDTVSLISLSVSAPGVSSSSTNLPVNMTAYPGGCVIDDATWTSADGGCKHVATGKVFSKISSATMNWHQAVWDSTAPSGNVAANGSDGGRTNDYDNSQGSHSPYPDASLSNYCHELTEGGQTDWRLPGWAELQLIGTGGGATRIVDSNRQAWSGARDSSHYPAYNAVVITLASGTIGHLNKTALSHAICIRP